MDPDRSTSSLASHRASPFATWLTTRYTFSKTSTYRPLCEWKSYLSERRCSRLTRRFEPTDL